MNDFTNKLYKILDVLIWIMINKWNNFSAEKQYLKFAIQYIQKTCKAFRTQIVGPIRWEISWLVNDEKHLNNIVITIYLTIKEQTCKINW